MAMNKFIRIIGGIVGLLEISVGVLLFIQYGTESVTKFGGAISLIVIGCVFLCFAFTGKSSSLMSSRIVNKDKRKRGRCG